MELIFGIAVLFLLVWVVIWTRSTNHSAFQTYQLMAKNNETLEGIQNDTFRSRRLLDKMLEENARAR